MLLLLLLLLVVLLLLFYCLHHLVWGYVFMHVRLSMCFGYNKKNKSRIWKINNHVQSCNWRFFDHSTDRPTNPPVYYSCCHIHGDDNFNNHTTITTALRINSIQMYNNLKGRWPSADFFPINELYTEKLISENLL